jgi:hypothetical protein
MATVAVGEEMAVAMLNRKEPAFTCAPAKAYEELMDRVENLELEQRRPPSPGGGTSLGELSLRGSGGMLPTERHRSQASRAGHGAPLPAEPPGADGRVVAIPASNGG